jgi:hypothetical protein
VSENKYLPSRLKSIRIALEGIKYVLVTQQNARIHGAFTLAVILFALLLRMTRVELVSLLLVIGLVWTAEIKCFYLYVYYSINEDLMVETCHESGIFSFWHSRNP